MYAEIRKRREKNEMIAPFLFYIFFVQITFFKKLFINKITIKNYSILIKHFELSTK